MSKFVASKHLAGIGSILLCLSFLLCSVFSVVHFIPFVFISCIIGICGMVPILIGIKGLAEHYKEDKIYKKTRTGAIFIIISYAVLPLMLLAALSYYFNFYNESPYMSAALWLGRVPLVLLSNAVSYTFIMVMAICFRQSFNGLANHSGKRLFHTASTTMFVGVIITFVLYIATCISAMLIHIASVRTILSEFISLFSLSSICSSFFVSVAFMILAVLFFTLKINPNMQINKLPFTVNHSVHSTASTP